MWSESKYSYRWPKTSDWCFCHGQTFYQEVNKILHRSSYNSRHITECEITLGRYLAVYLH